VEYSYEGSGANGSADGLSLQFNDRTEQPEKSKTSAIIWGGCKRLVQLRQRETCCAGDSFFT
jgi:hypothetical protein